MMIQEADAEWSSAVQPDEWFTSNQERQLFCLPHHTDIAEYGDLLNLGEHVQTMDAVTVYITGPVAYVAALQVLRAAGLVVLYSDGIKVVYC